ARPSLPREVRRRRLGDEGLVGIGDVARGDRADAPQEPRAVLVALEDGAQQGRGEEVEQREAERVVAPREVLGEIDAEGELGGSDRAQALLDELVELVRIEAHQRAGLEVLDGAHARDGAVTPGLCEQRNVVAEALVAIARREVVDARRTRRIAGVREVLARADDLYAGQVHRPGLRARRDQDVSHGGWRELCAWARGAATGNRPRPAS